MRTAYIVLFKNEPIFIYDTREEAEAYIQAAVKIGLEQRLLYPREQFKIKPIDYINDLGKQ